MIKISIWPELGRRDTSFESVRQAQSDFELVCQGVKRTALLGWYASNDRQKVSLRFDNAHVSVYTVILCPFGQLSH